MMSDEYGDDPRFFGRRQGRPLRKTAQRLIAEILPKLQISPSLLEGEIDLSTLFPEEKQAYWLEVGFGGGEHLAWQAAHHPDIGMIGAEVFINGVSSLLRHIEAGNLANIRIWKEDIRLILKHFPENAMERVFVLFPDPWPKKRHQARRFVSQENLDLVARLLVDGGILRIGTDDPTYQEWALEQMALRKDFRLVSEDIRKKPADWPDTRYEMKALREGRSPIYLEYCRVR